MAFKDPQKAKEYSKQWYEQNRERLTKHNKDYHRIKYDTDLEYKERRRLSAIAFIERHPDKRLLASSKATARKKGYEHTIDEKDIYIPTHCPYLGVELTNIQNSFKVPTNISIDRKDSSKGYIPDNVQVISYLANRMKQDATEEQLIAFALGILNVHKDKISSADRTYLDALIAHAELEQIGDSAKWVQSDLFQVRQSTESN